MSRDDAAGWWLADAVELALSDRAAPPPPGSDLQAERVARRAAAAPPTSAERAALAPGRFAKLAFRCAPRVVDGQERAGERIWVAVREVTGPGAYRGTLQGDPAVVPGLRSGDEVAFSAEHVVDVDRPEGALDFDRGAPAAVDLQVLQQGCPPTRLVRWQPEGYDEPIWFAGIDGSTDPQATLVSLGVLADAWPELTHPFAAGDTGVDWVRHHALPEYVPDRADHVRAMAAAAVAEAALLCLRQPRDPQAAAAEAALDDAVETLLRRYWDDAGHPAGGRFDGIAHAGISRDGGRIRLSGTARVREGADRPVEVDISPDVGGTVTLHAPSKRRGLRRRPEPEPPLTIPIMGRFTPRTLIEP